MQSTIIHYLPTKFRRFQSYSMTPLDSELNIENHNYGDNFLSNKKAIPEEQGAKSECFHHLTKLGLKKNPLFLNQSDQKSQMQGYTFQQTFKNSVESANRKDNSQDNTSNNNSGLKVKKLATSQIFRFHTSSDKNNFNKSAHLKIFQSTINKNDKSAIFSSNIEGKSKKQQNQKNQFERVPNFILEKRKKNQKEENQLLKQNQNCISTQIRSLSSIQTYDDLKKHSFKKQKSSEQQPSNSTFSQKTLFRPPSSLKISFSKATSSTLHTSFLRQKSCRTLKDFQDLQELREVESMQDSCQIHQKMKTFNVSENIDAQKYSHTSSLDKAIQNQINCLFSDSDESVSEQVNQQLKQQLDQLF